MKKLVLTAAILMGFAMGTFAQLLLLIGFGAAYAMKKRKKED